MTDTITIRPCLREEWPAFAECDYAMWRDIGVDPDGISDGWREKVLRFMKNAAETAHLQGYVALRGGRIIGSAAGHLYAEISPNVFEPSFRRIGYLWGVYVAPEYRGQGIAGKLTEAVVAHLASVGCTQIRLHASPAGRPVYEKLGFAPSIEMVLKLPTSAAK